MYEEDRKILQQLAAATAVEYRKNLIDIQKMFQFKIHKDDDDSHREDLKKGSFEVDLKFRIHLRMRHVEKYL